MKLKQRVIVMGSIFLTMVGLFTIGLQLNWPQPDNDRKTPPKTADNKPRITVKSSDNFQKLPSTKSSSHPSLVPPSLLRNRPRLRSGLNLTGLRAGPWPGVPRRMLEDTLVGFPKAHHSHEGGLSLSIPPEIAELNPWSIWRGWVEENSLYPQEAFFSDEMNHILATMATGNITSFGLGSKGTQLKATAMLGDQRTVFKPKRYPREFVLKGKPYAGFDRHIGEIAGFHLDGILGFRMAPPVVGRKINLTELKPVTSKKLLDTYLTRDGNTCFYGKCYYCKPSEAACAEGDIMEGSLTLWLPEWYKMKMRRHPYQRTYREGVKARWEVDPSYCRGELLQPKSEYYYGVLEFTDTAVFDFLMGNADRHHYETYSNAKNHGKLMHIDNGKTFSDPDHDELSVLAPLTQCCRFRSSTWQKLSEVALKEPLSQQLDKSMRRDPLWPILTRDHLKAIDRRLQIVIAEVQRCIATHNKETAIVDTWP